MQGRQVNDAKPSLRESAKSLWKSFRDGDKSKNDDKNKPSSAKRKKIGGLRDLCREAKQLKKVADAVFEEERIKHFIQLIHELEPKFELLSQTLSSISVEKEDGPTAKLMKAKHALLYHLNDLMANKQNDGYAKKARSIGLVLESVRDILWAADGVVELLRGNSVITKLLDLKRDEISKRIARRLEETLSKVFYTKNKGTLIAKNKEKSFLSQLRDGVDLMFDGTVKIKKIKVLKAIKQEGIKPEEKSPNEKTPKERFKALPSYKQILLIEGLVKINNMLRETLLYFDELEIQLGFKEEAILKYNINLLSFGKKSPFKGSAVDKKSLHKLTLMVKKALDDRLTWLGMPVPTDLYPYVQAKLKNRKRMKRKEEKRLKQMKSRIGMQPLIDQYEKILKENKCIELDISRLKLFGDQIAKKAIYMSNKAKLSELRAKIGNDEANDIESAVESHVDEMYRKIEDEMLQEKKSKKNNALSVEKDTDSIESQDNEIDEDDENEFIDRLMKALRDEPVINMELYEKANNAKEIEIKHLQLAVDKNTAGTSLLALRIKEAEETIESGKDKKKVSANYLDQRLEKAIDYARGNLKMLSQKHLTDNNKVKHLKLELETAADVAKIGEQAADQQKSLVASYFSDFFNTWASKTSRQLEGLHNHYDRKFSLTGQAQIGMRADAELKKKQQAVVSNLASARDGFANLAKNANNLTDDMGDFSPIQIVKLLYNNRDCLSALTKALKDIPSDQYASMLLEINAFMKDFYVLIRGLEVKLFIQGGSLITKQLYHEEGKDHSLHRVFEDLAYFMDRTGIKLEPQDRYPYIEAARDEVSRFLDVKVNEAEEIDEEDDDEDESINDAVDNKAKEEKESAEFHDFVKIQLDENHIQKEIKDKEERCKINAKKIVPIKDSIKLIDKRIDELQQEWRSSCFNRIFKTKPRKVELLTILKKHFIDSMRPGNTDTPMQVYKQALEEIKSLDGAEQYQDILNEDTRTRYIVEELSKDNISKKSIVSLIDNELSFLQKKSNANYWFFEAKRRSSYNDRIHALNALKISINSGLGSDLITSEQLALIKSQESALWLALIKDTDIMAQYNRALRKIELNEDLKKHQHLLFEGRTGDVLETIRLKCSVTSDMVELTQKFSGEFGEKSQQSYFFFETLRQKSQGEVKIAVDALTYTLGHQDENDGNDLTHIITDTQVKLLMSKAPKLMHKLMHWHHLQKQSHASDNCFEPESLPARVLPPVV